jgi:hypothetical protein
MLRANEGLQFVAIVALNQFHLNHLTMCDPGYLLH